MIKQQTEPTEQKTYLCTRPTIASALIERGYTCNKTVNPFNPNYSAWIFPKTADLMQTVAELKEGASR